MLKSEKNTAIDYQKFKKNCKIDGTLKLPNNPKTTDQTNKFPSKGLKISKAKVKSRYSREEIKSYMIKKDKRIRQNQKKKNLDHVKGLTKVKKNLQKLDKKRKIFSTSSNSKSSLNIHNLGKSERIEGLLEKSKNASLAKSGSKRNTKAKNKTAKTQKYFKSK